MGVHIKIIGNDDNSDEYRAALDMQQILYDSLPENSSGDIILYPSVTLWGQNVKDIDLLMVGHLENCEVKCDFVQDNQETNDFVKIESFCIPIEIKSHSVDGILRQGTDWFVKYSMRNHNVTRQSNEQKISLMRFFENTLQTSIYVTNLIWFTEINRMELNNLLNAGSRRIKSNVFCRETSFKEIVQLILWQKQPIKAGRKYVFNSSLDGADVSKIQKALSFFASEKKISGDLTRKKVEMITNSDFQSKLIISNDNDNIAIYRGRAGTGKTIGLIQTAIKLVDDEQARVLILTYNKALVSDIRRLFALADLPDMFDVRCVAIKTMHSFFYRLINKALYDGKLHGDTFIAGYDKYLSELIDFINEDSEANDMVKEICSMDPDLDWDYLCIDEAQDWSDQERDVVLKLFDNRRILVADGGQQFVRNIQPCDWSIVRDRTNIKLKKCLRQKSNLIKFINHFSDTFDLSVTPVSGTEKMLGGKVIIVSNQNQILPIVKREYLKMLDNGNIAYDLLMFATNESFHWVNGKKQFKYIDEYHRDGIDIWDGTIVENRDEGFANSEQIRLLQYESGRGLEGWTVVCQDFDLFMNEKKRQFDPDTKVDELLLESKEEKLEKYLLNWGLIPFTRAIDTLIVTLSNVESDVSKALRIIAYENSDYIEWV